MTHRPAFPAARRANARGPLCAQTAPATLVYGTTREPDTLNPQITVENPSFDLLAGVFDMLVKVDQYDNVVPDLATRWSISADSLTYTFHLRHGVRWADGAPFTARDVAFIYQQLRRTAAPSSDQAARSSAGR